MAELLGLISSGMSVVYGNPARRKHPEAEILLQPRNMIAIFTDEQ